MSDYPIALSQEEMSTFNQLIWRVLDDNVRILKKNFQNVKPKRLAELAIDQLNYDIRPIILEWVDHQYNSGIIPFEKEDGMENTWTKEI